jgi:amino acid adenylation domain-containing protein
MSDQDTSLDGPDGIAIIGMAGRFPGAQSVDEFWRNQLAGIEAISHFRVEQLEVANKAEVANDPRYVRSRSVLTDVDMFDAEFFGIYPREAELMDPQQRLFLECCWQALEDGGVVPDSYSGLIGVYAGSSIWSYFLRQLCTTPGFIEKFTSGYQISNYVEMMGNSLDFLATRVSYKLNLRGPSFTMLSACSTSLVAVTQACQSLLTYQSDLALAGGVSVTFPQQRGYTYQDGGMGSNDGHCRAFDADANGTIFGSGLGVVLLKRLDEALRDNDQIHAVIRGFAVNNDGASKIGYTAPSVEGQAGVIAMALDGADVDPETIGYIEAHGTGTPLGDPIELAGLTQAFRNRTSRRQFCVVGTAKTNVGHLDVAAGVTGLINATNVVRHGVFPPTLHFKAPNPKFDFVSSPFRVLNERMEWKTEHGPRRAGVSAFGVGGTNAHVIIEQAPEREQLVSRRPQQLLLLSARSPAALEQATDNLAAHLMAHPQINVADVAWTLQTGRRAFAHRRTVVAGSNEDAARLLSGRQQIHTRNGAGEAPQVYFLFPGQGSQHPNMGREIYDTEPVFRATVDRCAELLRPHLGRDLRTLLYPADGASEEAKRAVTETVMAQPAIFTIEYALAQLWLSWGIRPKAMAGHSVGELAAACVAGVIALEDALAFVALRGRLMQDVPSGGMLSVRLPEADLQQRLPKELSLAAVNSPTLCVVAGPLEPLAAFESQLNGVGIACRRLVTSHAFHSAMMDPLVEPLAAAVGKLKLNPPTIPYVSGVTGTWITAAEATDPHYWARHARAPVHFSAAVRELRSHPDAVLLEVGPGTVLATLARQHGPLGAGQAVMSSLSDGYSGTGDYAALMAALGDLWLAGETPDWAAMAANERRQKVSLPTYPFERKRFWLQSAAAANATTNPGSTAPLQGAVTEAQPFIVQGSEAVNKMSDIRSTPTATDPAANRAGRIRSALIDMFADLSGVDLAAADSATTFLELGFDSLFLTQVAQAVQEKFSVKITFRQLLGDLSSLAALTGYVAGQLPPDAFADPLSAAPVTAPTEPPAIITAVAPASAAQMQPVPAAQTVAAVTVAEGAIERVMREQLQAMNQLFAKQLDTLNVSAARPAPAAAAVPAPAAAGPAAVVQSQMTPMKALEVLASPDAGTPSKPFGPYKPPQATSSQDMSEHQQKHLAALVDRVARRTARSKAFTQKYRPILADPRVVSGFRPQWKEMVYSMVTDRSKGSKLWDIDGNEYIDLVNGFGPIMLGHRPDFVAQAIETQLHAGFEIGPQTPLAGEVAELFCELTGNERVAFCNTGSEAVLAALRVCRTVTGRNKVVMFTGDYHGMFDEVLVKGFMNKAGEPQSAPIAPGIPRQSVSNMVVLDYGTEQSLEWIRRNANDLAAVIVEPVQSRHPSLQPVEFLKELRKITEESGTAFVFDEVVTGFRVHQGGCQAKFGIRADLATYGKVVAGGMPVGVIAGKSRFMDALDGGMWQFGDDSFPQVGVTFFAGTFVRHPLTLAAMRAVLKHFKEEGPQLQERLNERTTSLVSRLNDTLHKHAVPTRIEHFGSVFYLSFPVSEPLSALFYFYLRDKGIHIREGFPCFMTTAHSDADIEAIVRAFDESAAEMRRAGFFTATAVPAPQAVPALVEDMEKSVDLTEPQREIFLAAMLSDEASCAYNESFSVRLRGELKTEALRESVNALVARHESLRATIDADGTLLRIRPKLAIDVPVRDLEGAAAASRDQEFERILDADARMPFDLLNGPLVRTVLVRLGRDDHALVVTAHHLVCDGWSTNVMVEEMAKLYTAMAEGRDADLEPAVRFSEYARIQAEERRSGKQDAVEAYWLNQFKDLPPPLDLPTDRPRHAIKTQAGASLRAKIDADGYLKIKRLGAKRGCTLFATLLAGFNALLHRLTNQDDIVVGIPAAGQSLLNDGNLVGHCVNFLPLRAKIAETSSFAELLNQTKLCLLDGYDHQNYTYGTLVRKLGVRRDPARLPLMEVQFNLERLGAGAKFSGLSSDVEPNPKAAVILDLFFNIIESDKGLVVDCDYNSDLFDEQTIALWLQYFETLLLDAVSDPDKKVNDLSLMAPGELAAFTSEGKLPAPAQSPSQSIVAMFEVQAARIPDKVAVQLGEERLTYRELNARANQVARMLIKRGVTPSSLVATSFERSPEMIVAMLAVLKAGAAYVPLDASYPIERLVTLLDDAKPAALLTHEKLVASLPQGAAQTICLDRDAAAISEEDQGNLAALARPDSLAYVIYTSGSTGKPKGVLINHDNVARLLTSTEPWFGFGDSDVWTLFHSSSFDFSVWEIWGCLLTGGRLVIVPYLVTRSPQDFYGLLAQERVTVLNQTPAAFYQLIQVEESGVVKPLSLRYVIFGGEALNFAQLRPWLKRHGDSAPQLVNMYGITETTVHVTYRPLTAADIEGEPRSLIGAPIPDLKLYVLDAKRQPVPPGVPGEIYVGGAGVAQGYLNRPDLSADRFMADPFAGTPGARMYKSGDLARLLKTGDVEYLGRADSQIKIRGFRIEPGEIESALVGHPGVQQAAVVVRADSTGTPKLVAYVVPKAGAALGPSELREFLQKKLPGHMIPHACVPIEAIPLTINGKVDQKSLPAVESAFAVQESAYVPPRTEQEEKLAQVICEVLRLDRVGITDNLFELGADSLHVFQITSRAVKAGLHVTPKLVLQQRTISGIMEELSAGRAQSQVQVISPVERRGYRVRREASLIKQAQE